MSMMSFDSGGYSFSDADPQDILTLLDTFAEEFAGPGASRTPRQFSSGLWICYGCTTQLGDSSVPAKIYARISGSELQLVIFAGNSELSSVQDDMIMNLCVL